MYLDVINQVSYLRAVFSCSHSTRLWFLNFPKAIVCEKYSSAAESPVYL